MPVEDFPDSWYCASANELHPREPLQGDTRCDVCIIGGGFTGVSAALRLAELGYQVVLLEAQRIGWGASGRNGGQAGGDPRHDVDELEDILGADLARKHWDLHYSGLDYLRGLIEQHRIDCDWQAGIIHTGYNRKERDWTCNYVDKLQREYDADFIEFIDSDRIHERVGCAKYSCGLRDGRSGHLHPLNFVRGLARAAEAAGAQIFEASKVQEIVRGQPLRIRCATGEVSCDKLVLGCNGYLEQLEPRIASKIMPINNYVLATEPLSDERANLLIREREAVADSKFVVNYFRLSADNRMLFGGGETYSHRFPRDLKNFVRPFMLKIFPQLEDVAIDYAWGGTLAVTMNRFASMGRLDNIYYAQGYSGHGVVLATFAGKMMAEAINGDDSDFDVFCRLPMPGFPGGTLLRKPGLVAGMLFYSMLDRFK